MTSFCKCNTGVNKGEKRCSSNFLKFHRKTSELESLFNKAAGLQVCNFIKKWLQHRCFPKKFANFLRTPVLKNICEQVILAKTSKFTQIQKQSLGGVLQKSVLKMFATSLQENLTAKVLCFSEGEWTVDESGTVQVLLTNVSRFFNANLFEIYLICRGADIFFFLFFVCFRFLLLYFFFFC